MKRILVGVTGASGSLYALSLLKELKAAGVSAHLVATSCGKKVVEHELGLSFSEFSSLAERTFEEDDFFAPPASGSSDYDAMVVIPCSMGTLSAVARGSARNLLQRAADVMLKERRPLVLVVRETPLSSIHLRNMLELTEAGAVIYPAMPAFYNNPASLEDLVADFVKRLVKFLGIEVRGFKRWGEEGS